MDRLTNWMTFAMAAVLTGMSFSTLALLGETEFTNGVAILMVVYLVVAGFSAALATIGALVSVIKNFTRVVAILPIGLFISYLKIAPQFDEAVKEVFFQETGLQAFLFYVAGITISVYLLSIIFCRKIDMTKEHKKEC